MQLTEDNFKVNELKSKNKGGGVFEKQSETLCWSLWRTGRDTK